MIAPLLHNYNHVPFYLIFFEEHYHLLFSYILTSNDNILDILHAIENGLFCTEEQAKTLHNKCEEMFKSIKNPRDFSDKAAGIIGEILGRNTLWAHKKLYANFVSDAHMIQKGKSAPKFDLEADLANTHICVEAKARQPLIACLRLQDTIFHIYPFLELVLPKEDLLKFNPYAFHHKTGLKKSFFS